MKSKGGKRRPKRVSYGGDRKSSLGKEIAIPMSLVDPGQIYSLRCPYTTYISSSAAGIINQFYSLSPAVTTFAGFSSMGNLFGEVRVVKSEFCISNVNPHSDGYATGVIKDMLCIGFDDKDTGSNPGSVLVCLAKNDAWVYNQGSTDVSMCVVSSPRRGWASTSTPAPGAFAGCTGAYQIYATNLSVSTIYHNAVLWVEFQFRSRLT